VREGYEEPDNAGNGEEDGGEEETVVIPELRDCGRGGESTGSTGDLIEDVLVGMGWSEELQ